MSVFDFSVSPFSASLAAFDPTIQMVHLIQVRVKTPLNFTVFFRHTPTRRLLAYDLTTNLWQYAFLESESYEDPYVPQLL